MTLTEFLLARIAEDEKVSREIRAARHRYEPGATQRAELRWVEDSGWPFVGCDPARVLVECEAKRRIVSRLTDRLGDCYDLEEYLRDLAVVYADHPDYRQEWKP